MEFRPTLSGCSRQSQLEEPESGAREGTQRRWASESEATRSRGCGANGLHDSQKSAARAWSLATSPPSGIASRLRVERKLSAGALSQPLPLRSLLKTVLVGLSQA